MFFDGPAGSQVPRRVIDAVAEYYTRCNANHGGLFQTSRQSDAILLAARQALADFLGTADPDTVAFGPNMTSLTFALSRSLAKTWRSGDEVLVTRLEHDANFTPWILAARDAGASQWDQEKIFGLFPRIRERLNNRGNELSGGEQQMLAIARALFSNPDFMLMDEPTEGLAPLLVQEVGDVILKMKEGGMSILIVEQNLLFALGVSTETHLMSKGTIVYSSFPQELWENQEVKYQYLGV